MRTITKLLLLAFSCSMSAACLGSCSNKPSQQIVQPETKKPLPAEQVRIVLPRTVSIGDYSLEIWDASESRAPFYVFKTGDKDVYKQELGKQDALCVLSMNGNPLLKMTSGKSRYVILENHKGDETYENLVFKLGRQFKKFTSVTSKSPISLVERNGHVRIKMQVEDLYPEWGARTVAPHIQIVYKLQGQKFVYDIKAMKEANKKERDLVSQRIVIRDQFSRLTGPSSDPVCFAPPELADEVLCLYYAGEAKLARKFYDACWPGQRSGPDWYWSFLMARAQKSEYWPAICAMNGLQSVATIPKKSRI